MVLNKNNVFGQKQYKELADYIRQNYPDMSMYDFVKKYARVSPDWGTPDFENGSYVVIDGKEIEQIDVTKTESVNNAGWKYEYRHHKFVIKCIDVTKPGCPEVYVSIKENDQRKSFNCVGWERGKKFYNFTTVPHNFMLINFTNYDLYKNDNTTTNPFSIFDVNYWR